MFGIILIKKRKVIFELYDLSKDIVEAYNIAEKHPEVVKEFKGLIKETSKESL